MANTFAHYNHDGDGDCGYATREEATADADEIVEFQGDNACCYTIYEVDENEIIITSWVDGDTVNGSKNGQPLYNA